MRFSVVNYEARMAMHRARVNARVRRETTMPAELRGLEGEALAEALRDRVAVMFCGSRERFDAIFEPMKGAL